jgi:hypothetical protein
MAKSKRKFIACGVPIEELQIPLVEKRKSGQYLLPQLVTRLKAKQIEIIP